MKYNYNLNVSEKYIEILEKGISLYGIFSKKKKLSTIEFFKSKLNDEDFEVEQLASGFIMIGHVYLEFKDYEFAAFYFNKGFSLGKDVPLFL